MEGNEVNVLRYCVLVLYLRVLFLCHFLLLLHHISEGNTRCIFYSTTSMTADKVLFVYQTHPELMKYDAAQLYTEIT